MKKIYFLAMLLCAGFAFTSCDDDEEDSYDKVTFEGTYFTQLIDSSQYGGELLYGEDAKNYSWTDEETGLTGGMTNAWGGQYGFSEGGTAISNYIDANISEHNTYEYQLAVPVKNKSANFAVVYAPATISLPEAEVIRSMDIINTTYTLGVLTYGDTNAYAKALTEEGDYLTLTISADNGKSLDVDLARDGNFISKWTNISLVSLGEVKSLTFTMSGSDNSSFGVKTPTYFAFDNVVIDD